MVLAAAGELPGTTVRSPAAGGGPFFPPSVPPAGDAEEEDVVDTLDLTAAPDWRPRRRGGGDGMATASDDTDGATTDGNGDGDGDSDDSRGGGGGERGGWAAVPPGGPVAAGAAGGAAAGELVLYSPWLRARPRGSLKRVTIDAGPAGLGGGGGGWLGGVKRRRLRRGGLLAEGAVDAGDGMGGTAGWAGGEPAGDTSAAAARRSWPRYVVSPGAGLGPGGGEGGGAAGEYDSALVPYAGPWIDQWRRGRGAVGGGHAGLGSGEYSPAGGEGASGDASVEVMELDGAEGGDVHSEEDLMDG